VHINIFSTLEPKVFSLAKLFPFQTSFGEMSDLLNRSGELDNALALRNFVLQRFQAGDIEYIVWGRERRLGKNEFAKVQCLKT